MFFSQLRTEAVARFPGIAPAPDNSEWRHNGLEALKFQPENIEN